MSSGVDFPLKFFQQYANKYMTDLQPYCERFLVVGSVRRCKPVVHDIEFLVIPKQTQTTDMFGTAGKPTIELDAVIGDLVRGWNASLITNGERLKKVILAEGLPLEINISSETRWAVESVIKTGPADFSRRVVTTRRQGGLLPSNCVIKDGWQVYRNGSLVPMQNEEEFLEFLELGWINPQER